VRSFHIITFGCQMNQHDSAKMADLLVQAGFREEPEPELAQVIILNTCSVRDKAEQKLRSELGRLGITKRARPEMVLVVAGCMGSQHGDRLLRAVPELDLVIGPDNIAALPGLLADLELGGPRRALTEHDLSQPRFLTADDAARSVPPSASVTTMKGCDERCSFCIVPQTRGPERYRPSGQILDEIAALVRGGCREVTLLGQTVNSYRDPTGSLAPAPEAGRTDWRCTTSTAARQDESEFAALLFAIAESCPNLERLRYTSPHPRHMTRALIAAHRALPMLCRHVHLPVQSGSDRVLKRMIRRYRVDEYLERVDALREAVPGMSLSTDVIVGFCGETEQDFQQTLGLVERGGFVGLFGFKYSPRPDTAALRLPDDVPEAEKASRLQRLFELSDRQRSQHLKQLVGSRQRMLVEGRKPDGAYFGRTERNEIIHFGSRVDVVGKMVEVVIERAFKNSLAGELTDASSRLAASSLPRLDPSRRPEVEPQRQLTVLRWH